MEREREREREREMKVVKMPRETGEEEGCGGEYTKHICLYENVLM